MVYASFILGALHGTWHIQQNTGPLFSLASLADTNEENVELRKYTAHLHVEIVHVIPSWKENNRKFQPKLLHFHFSREQLCSNVSLGLPFTIA